MQTTSFGKVMLIANSVVSQSVKESMQVGLREEAADLHGLQLTHVASCCLNSCLFMTIPEPYDPGGWFSVKKEPQTVSSAN